MMIEKLASIVAVSIYRHAKQKSIRVAILKYGLIIVFDAVLIVALSLTIGGITGKLLETAIGIVCFLVLRAVSGGHHLNTSTSCILLSTFISASIPHIPLHGSLFVILTLLSILLFSIYSPSNLQKQSRIPPEYYPFLKILSIVMVAGSYLLQMEVITLAVFVQAISLIHFKTRREVTIDGTSNS